MAILQQSGTANEASVCLGVNRQDDKEHATHQEDKTHAQPECSLIPVRISDCPSRAVPVADHQRAPSESLPDGVQAHCDQQKPENVAQHGDSLDDNWHSINCPVARL
jgi:hypothetical protein